MADLKLNGLLNLKGQLDLKGRDGGKVKVGEIEVLVEVTKGDASANPNVATWPGMVQRSLLNPTVTIHSIPINVQGDMGTTLPNGGPVIFSQSGQ